MPRTPWAGSTSTGFPRTTRARILHRDPACTCHGCPHCTPTGCTRPSTEADHITEVSDGGTHDETNGAGICGPCHQHKTIRHAVSKQPRRRRPPEPHPGLR